MDVIDSLYPALKVGDITIWDLTDFDKAEIDDLLTDDSALQPKKKSEKYITFCKCDFNIQSLICEKATSEDILLAWTMARDALKLDRLVRLSIRDSMYYLYLTRHLHEEPDTVLLLRLVYWYYRCKTLSDTFKYKTTEIKKKLTRGLLNQREKLSKQSDANVDDTVKLNTLILDWEHAIPLVAPNTELWNKSQNYRITWFKDVWNVTSELLLAGVCGDSNFKVTFEPPSTTQDYDFIINGYPAQVKSLNTPQTPQSLVSAKKERMHNVVQN